MVDDNFQSDADRIPDDVVEGDFDLPSQRAPEHPGTILKRVFLNNHDLTQEELAEAMDTYPQRVSELVNGHKRITPRWAYKLARAFDNSPKFWLSMQETYDLYQFKQSPEFDEIDDVKKVV